MPNCQTFPNSYVCIDRELLDNPNISCEAKGFICWCLSRPPDWIYNTSHLQKALGLSRGKVLALYKVAIEHGYLTRFQQKKAGSRYGVWTYIFHNVGTDPEQIKKMFPKSVFPTPEKRTPNNIEFLSIDKSIDKMNNIEEPPKKSSPPKKKPPAPPPPQVAIDLAEYFLASLRKKNPKFRKPKVYDWPEEFDRMMREDNRTEEEIRKVIDWREQDTHWKKCALNPQKFAVHFDTMWAQSQGELEESRVSKNRSWVNVMKKNKPQVIGHLRVTKTAVIEDSTGKDLGFDFDHEDFVQKFRAIFVRKDVR